MKHIISKSNRNMSAMFVLFSLLSDIDVSYKSVERLYSDPEVIAVLHNLHALILKKKGVKEIDGSGDGTGYALTIKTHYATEAQKLKEKVKDAGTQSSSSSSKKEEQPKKRLLFVYSFALMDIKSRMYVGFGTSFRSEKEAYIIAVKMAKYSGIKIKSLRLDRYFSGQSTVKFLVETFGREMKLFLIPKSNATVKGPWPWKRMLAGRSSISRTTSKETSPRAALQRIRGEPAGSWDRKDLMGWTRPTCSPRYGTISIGWLDSVPHPIKVEG